MINCDLVVDTLGKKIVGWLITGRPTSSGGFTFAEADAEGWHLEHFDLLVHDSRTAEQVHLFPQLLDQA
jgi:hypothetical protein